MQSAVLSLLRRAAGSVAFRVVVTIALLAVVFSRLDWALIGDKITEGQPAYGLLAVLCLVGAVVIGAFRWRALLHLAQIEMPRRELIRIYLVTSFANAFLPTSVGGDVARPLMVSRRGPELVRAATTVLIERLVAVVALLVVALAGLATDPSSVRDGATGSLVLASLGTLAALVLLAWRPAFLRAILVRVVPERLRTHTVEVRLVIGACLRAPTAMGVVLLQSLAFQCLVTMQIVLLAKMIGVELSFGLAAVTLALVTLAMLVPISIGGFGVREGSYVVLLAGGGIGHTDAVLLSLLTVVALFLATLPGAVELIRGGFSPALRGEAS